MREILFRGKRKDNEEWVEGNLIRQTNFYGDPVDKYHIMLIGEFQYDYYESHEVIPETVGQYTGFVDINGTKIFEGDVFQLEDDIIGVVDFNHGCFFLTEYGLRGVWTESGYDECGGGWGVIDREPMHFWHISKLEVIGNIHDNPELLEVHYEV